MNQTSHLLQKLYFNVHRLEAQACSQRVGCQRVFLSTIVSMALPNPQPPQAGIYPPSCGQLPSLPPANCPWPPIRA